LANFTSPEEEGEIDFSTISAPAEEEDREELVFLVPGIRSDGIWAQEFQCYVENAYQNVLCKPVRGNLKSTDRLSSWHLASRFGLSDFRKSFFKQIFEVSNKYPDHNISIVAHSMGSSILSEILPQLSKELEKKGRAIDAIVILGGVCHINNSEDIQKSCNRVINHVGVRDHVCYLSTIIRPLDYCAVGLFGFVNAFVGDRLFDNDHSSCIGEHHLIQRVLPEIAGRESAIITGSSYQKNKDSVYRTPPRRRYSYKSYIYTRRVCWLLLSPLIMSIYVIDVIRGAKNNDPALLE